MKIRVSKSRFKSRALEYLRSVEQSGEAIVITDHGRPAVEVVPYKKTDKEPLELLRGSVLCYERAVEPVGTEDWEALR